jgi:hypothetical protein
MAGAAGARASARWRSCWYWAASSVARMRWGVDLHLRGLALELLQAIQPRGQLLHAGACERGLGDVLLGGAGLLQPGLQLVAHLEGQGRQGAALHLVQGQRRGLALERPGQVRQVRGVHQRILRQRRQAWAAWAE